MCTWFRRRESPWISMSGSEYRAKYDKLRQDLTIEDQPNLHDVYRGERDLSDICMGCDKSKVREEHPLFEGSLCRRCYTDIKEWGLCSVNGSCRYCAVCTNCGDMLVCDNESCARAYCFGCIKDFVGEAQLKKLKDADEDKKWKCFHCAKWTKKTHNMLRPRKAEETLDRLKRMYHGHVPAIIKELDSKLGPEDSEVKTPRGLRVLSLFDGIGAGIVALKQLNLDIEYYGASEIDKDAILVTRTQHPEVEHLGDIIHLNRERLLELGPFDLLIGGSPCNELSRANPVRKGLYGGSGLLFFEFHRIKSELGILWPGHHTFFLYENVDGMGGENESTISRFLNCGPAMWDASAFAPMKRRRCFWGDIPGLASPPDEDSSFMLEEVLMANRRPNVERLATITTKRHSMLQGKQKRFPVKMGNEGSVLWSPEFEVLFGFPRHYTDVGDLDRTKRQRLVGKSWCVTTVRTILSPLRFFFKRKEEETTKR